MRADVRQEVMLNLPEVSLICIDCVDVERAVKALKYSAARCNFASVKLVSSISTSYTTECRKISSLEDYSNFVVEELFAYVETSHCLVVQHDGWVCNPEAWEARWLEYDYVGGVADWTEPGPEGKGGNGGFSLRSRKLLKEGRKIRPQATYHPEDCFYSACEEYRGGGRSSLELAGMRVAPRSAQERFCVEKAKWAGQFGHHQCDLSNWTPPP